MYSTLAIGHMCTVYQEMLHVKEKDKKETKTQEQL